MIVGTELVDHVFGLGVVVSAVLLPGWLLGRMTGGRLRRDAWALWPTLGVVYWAVALFVFPWRGGLYLAAGLLGCAAAAVLLRGRAEARAPGGRGIARPPRRLPGLHPLVLLGGCLPFVTPLFIQHAPPGMDASRYIYAARLIARQAGLPASLEPFAPEIAFGAANHGLPALAGVAVMLGVSPAAAVLATMPLAFFALIFSLYALLRPVARRLPAAVIAVSAVWLARESQTTPAWGGFAGVCALAVGVGAARLLLEVLRRGGLGTAGLLGLCAGALPLIHGCMAAGWLYILAPVAGFTGLSVSKDRRSGLRALFVSMIVGAALLGAYFFAARPSLSQDAAEWIRMYELRHLEGGGLVAAYLAHALGRVLTGLTLGALGLLAFHGRWRGVLVVSAVLLLSGAVLIAGTRELLPGSLLLYPTRLREFPLPATALALALAWRVLPIRGRPAVLAGVVLLALGLGHHVRYYQHAANSQRLPEGVWQALLWVGEHLDPVRHLVASEYGTGGALLPGVAGIATTGLHVHIADFYPAVEQRLARRPLTHVFVISEEAAQLPPSDGHTPGRSRMTELIAQGAGELVYENGPARVYRLDSARPLASALSAEKDEARSQGQPED